jgi:hypothetical protein
MRPILFYSCPNCYNKISGLERSIYPRYLCGCSGVHYWDFKIVKEPGLNGFESSVSELKAIKEKANMKDKNLFGKIDEAVNDAIDGKPCDDEMKIPWPNIKLVKSQNISWQGNICKGCCFSIKNGSRTINGVDCKIISTIMSKECARNGYIFAEKTKLIPATVENLKGVDVVYDNIKDEYTIEHIFTHTEDFDSVGCVLNNGKKSFSSRIDALWIEVPDND